MEKDSVIENEQKKKIAESFALSKKLALIAERGFVLTDPSAANVEVVPAADYCIPCRGVDPGDSCVGCSISPYFDKSNLETAREISKHFGGLRAFRSVLGAATEDERFQFLVDITCSILGVELSESEEEDEVEELDLSENEEHVEVEELDLSENEEHVEVEELDLSENEEQVEVDELELYKSEEAVEELELPESEEEVEVEELELSVNEEEIEVEEQDLSENGEEAEVEELDLSENGEEAEVEELDLSENGEQAEVEELDLSENEEQVEVEEEEELADDPLLPRDSHLDTSALAASPPHSESPPHAGQRRKLRVRRRQVGGN